MSDIFEIEISGRRVEITAFRLFEAIGSGEVRLGDVLILNGVPGRVRDLDERMIDGENVFFLKGTPQETRVMKRFLDWRKYRRYSRVETLAPEPETAPRSYAPERDDVAASPATPVDEPTLTPARGRGYTTAQKARIALCWLRFIGVAVAFIALAVVAARYLTGAYRGDSAWEFRGFVGNLQAAELALADAEFVEPYDDDDDYDDKDLEDLDEDYDDEDIVSVEKYRSELRSAEEDAEDAHAKNKKRSSGNRGVTNAVAKDSPQAKEELKGFFGDDDIAGLLDENLKPERTWQTALAESRDKVDDWETLLATIVVPDDYATLAEAIEAASDDDVIWVSPGKRQFAKPTLKHRPVVAAKADKKLVIRGRSDDPADAVVTLTARDMLAFESCKARVRGITFQFVPDSSKTEQEALFRIGKNADVVFKYCRFVGSLVEDCYGVRVVDGKASFWKCGFESFSRSGLFAEDGGRVNAGYCEFGRDNACALEVARRSKAVALTCRLFSNKVGLIAREGGKARVEDSFFEDNREPWSIKLGTTQNVEMSNNVVF